MNNSEMSAGTKVDKSGTAEVTTSSHSSANTIVGSCGSPKIRPILFSMPMVKAILEGRKTQTRRVVKNEVNGYKNKVTKQSICPYGCIGDILWVRESFRAIEQDFGSPRYEYRATETINTFDKWKPSIHMPYDACRLWLRIIDIRFERLHDITSYDAVKEGINYWNIDRDAFEGGELIADYENYMWRDDERYEDYHFPTYADPISSYMSLWEKINGTQSLKSNPFVWVIEFERCSKP